MCSFLAAFPARGWPREVVSIRRKYIGAQATRVIVAAPERATPPCEYFGECTGCQWQHITYEAQLAAKTGIVRDALERVGRFHNPAPLGTLPAPEQYGYRNHARFNCVAFQRGAGFYAPGTAAVCGD